MVGSPGVIFTRNPLMIIALRDVEASVRNLRGYVVQFQRSKAAAAEHENLSETVIGALKGYDADIFVVKRILPSKLLERVDERTRWALKKRERQEPMERITQRNSSLTTALGIMETYGGNLPCYHTLMCLVNKAYTYARILRRSWRNRPPLMLSPQGNSQRYIRRCRNMKRSMSSCFPNRGISLPAFNR